MSELKYTNCDGEEWLVNEKVIKAIKDANVNRGLAAWERSDCAYCGRWFGALYDRYFFYNVVHGATGEYIAIPRCKRCFQIMVDRPKAYKKHIPTWVQVVIWFFSLMLLWVSCEVVLRADNKELAVGIWFTFIVIIPIGGMMTYLSLKSKKRRQYERLLHYHACGLNRDSYGIVSDLDLLYYSEQDKKRRTNGGFNNFAINYKLIK